MKRRSSRNLHKEFRQRDPHRRGTPLYLSEKMCLDKHAHTHTHTHTHSHTLTHTHTRTHMHTHAHICTHMHMRRFHRSDVIAHLMRKIDCSNLISDLS